MTISKIPPRHCLNQTALPTTIAELIDVWTGAHSDFKTATRISLTSLCLLITLAVQAQITGTVFQDYNANGIRDAGEPGRPGVVVKAFVPTGGGAGLATTDANGLYTITPSGTAPYRIEFTSLGAGYFAGAAGPSSGTSVQFVYTANGRADLGVYNATDNFCKPNPQVAVPCYINGDPLKDIGTPGSASVQDALVSLAYNSQGTTPDVAHYATMATIGTVWGLAYQKESKKLFSGAFIKRHAGLGPLGTGGIYVTDVATGATANFFKLDEFAGISTGPDPHVGLPSVPTIPNYDAATYTQVGKVGLGDIELSEDGTVLYVVNLFDRKLYSFPVGNPAVKPTTFRAFDIPRPNGDDSRPFALKIYRGKVYIGVTGTSESEYVTTVKANPVVVASNLKGYVYEIDPNAASPVFTNVLEFPFSYTKGASIDNNPATDKWYPWVPAYNKANNDPPFLYEADYAAGTRVRMYPQPWLTGIEITDDGAMILGIRNREGDQIGQFNFLPDPTGQDTTLVRTHGVGDLLKAGKCDPATNRWTIETNAAVCGGVATAGKDNNQGPGGGEFYYQDNLVTHQETSNGSLALLPGSDEVMTTLTDPLQVYSGGVRRYSNTTGQGVGAAQVFQSYINDASTFGKSAGLGDIELLLECGDAPIEIGNRIWVDQDEDGLQGAGEPGLDGITLDLYQGDRKVGTTQTNIFGEYYFNANNVPGGLTVRTAYQIRIGSAQGRLANFTLTQTNAGGNELLDNDASVAGGRWVVDVTTGNKGENNHSYDIGVKCAIIATASANVALCQDGTISLTATGGTNYQWSGPNGFSSTLPNPVIPNAGPAAFGRYTVDAITLYPVGFNSVPNSNFNNKNTGFSSDYTYTDGNPLANSGRYNVVQLPYTAPGAFLGDDNALPTGLTDHTSGTPIGYIQLAMGATTANQRVWYQTIPVKPNSRYRFSFAAVNTTLNPRLPKPHVSATINGEVVIADQPLTDFFRWQQFDYSWESGANTTATFAIINPATGGTGNQFALDDVAINSFSSCAKSASIVVSNSPSSTCIPVSIRKIRRVVALK